MYCPSLKDLPPPPPGKTGLPRGMADSPIQRGWPWTEESPPLSNSIYPVECDLSCGVCKLPHREAYSSGMLSALSPLPKISIVTPSYNQGQFIEETIRSVLLQGYPNLEYIIIDGGSTDNSVEIIKKYEKWLTCWVSEPDKGQSDAINKGWRKSTGEILAWLNSDDLYLPDTLNIVAEYFSKNPKSLMIYGNCKLINKRGEEIEVLGGFSFDAYRLLTFNYIPQPSLFLRKGAFERVKLLDIDLHYIMDWDLLLRLAINLKRNEITNISQTLSCLRIYPECKTVSGPSKILQELQIVYKKLSSLHIPASGAFGEKKMFKYFLYQNMGRRFYEKEDLTNARRSYCKALYSNPFSLPSFIYNIGRTFLPPRIVKTYRNRKELTIVRSIIRKWYNY